MLVNFFYNCYLLDTLCRKSKKWCSTQRFFSGSTQESSMVADFLSSSAGSCRALRKTSCSSVGRTGSGSSLKNCLTRPATSHGRAVDRHSSPASILAWTKGTSPAVLRRFTESRSGNESEVNVSHHSPWVLSVEPQSLIFWTVPLCPHVPSAPYRHRPEIWTDSKWKHF